MAFSDLAAPVTPRIAETFRAEIRPLASFLPAMVFLWFLLLSIPIASWMNRIGRKRMAVTGDMLAAAGLAIAYAAGEGGGPACYFVGFGLLGIGCTAIQVSVNPMLALLAPRGQMTAYLTLGQVFRNTALLLLAPIVSCFVLWVGSWRPLLLVYALLTVGGGVWMALTRFDDPQVDRPAQTQRGSWRACLSLLSNPVVAVSAGAIGVFLMLDVGVGYLSVQLVDSPNPLLTTTGFYACRIVGTLAGIWALSRIDDLKYLKANLAVAVVMCAGLLVAQSAAAVYLLVGVLGFTLACVFSTFFAAATKAASERANEVSGLMILTIAAGALSAPVIGAVIRATGEARTGAWFLIPCALYLWWAARYVKRSSGRKRG